MNYQINQQLKSLAFYLVLVFMCLKTVNAQILPQKVMTDTFISLHFNDSLLTHKMMDSTFKQQISGALLFYPELKNINIRFKVKKALSPLTARPTVWAIFQKPKNRHYLIIISDKTMKMLDPILLKNLSFNAQMGVIGHELGHITYYNQKKGAYFIKLILMHLSTKSMDIFENDTDKRCIEHGLGYQLLAWSTEVRQKLNIKEWNGANQPVSERERYMSPAAILAFMKTCTQY